MGAKAKAKLDFSALKKLEGDPYAEFLKSIPPMVEEKQELKELKGSEIIEILKKQKAKKEEIAVIDPKRTYKRVFVSLVQMDHEANCKKAFAKGGIKALENYKKFVIEQSYKMRGKYPELAKNPKLMSGKVSPIQKIKNLFNKLFNKK